MLLPSQAAGLEAAPDLARGAVFFMPAGTALSLQSNAAAGPMLVRNLYAQLVRASCHRVCGYALLDMWNDEIDLWEDAAAAS